MNESSNDLFMNESSTAWFEVSSHPLPAYRRVECLLNTGVSMICYQSPPEVWSDAGVRVTGSVAKWRFLPREVEFPSNEDE